MNDDTLRDRWIAGQKCEIFSMSKGLWFTGKITKIFIDHEGEWLEIVYNKTCTKQVQRFSPNVRPHPKYYDIERCKLLVHGYVRFVQNNVLTDPVPRDVDCYIFEYYFVGHDVLDDDEFVSDDSEKEPPLFSPFAALEYVKYQMSAPSPAWIDKPVTHTFVYPATKHVRRRKTLDDIHEINVVSLPLLAADDYINNECMVSSPSPSTPEPNRAQLVPFISAAQRRKLDLRDDVLCTMSQLLLELTPMFKVTPMRRLACDLQQQLSALQLDMKHKKQLRQERLVSGFIRSIQCSLTRTIIIPVEVTELCLSYYDALGLIQ
mmetsp:Transcript_55474/g.92213  ORF Transcript_55474/g.92213 Transcript_55474/m.92213 type:complete len:319 (-) Transcript_55474:290-1246(-)